jgi:hypothetical protein
MGAPPLFSFRSHGDQSDTFFLIEGAAPTLRFMLGTHASWSENDILMVMFRTSIECLATILIIYSTIVFQK